MTHRASGPNLVVNAVVLPNNRQPGPLRRLYPPPGCRAQRQETSHVVDLHDVVTFAEPDSDGYGPDVDTKQISGGLMIAGFYTTCVAYLEQSAKAKFDVGRYCADAQLDHYAVDESAAMSPG